MIFPDYRVCEIDLLLPLTPNTNIETQTMTNDNQFGVLFVDDEEKALKYFERAFKNDFQIFTAESAAKGRAILDDKNSDIGVLITDQRMPEEKGVELLKYARKNYPQITRMLTTAYSDLDDAIEAVNSGEILRYVTKPWDIQVLTTELRQAMQFFELRRERDQLMREKLSAWQRMKGVNRMRDILVMSSAFTLTKNALPAAQAFLEQIPFNASSNSSNPTFNHWEELKSDIQEMLAIAENLIRKINGDDSDSKASSVDVGELLKSASRLAGVEESLNIASEISASGIEINERLVEQMLKSLLAWLGQMPGSNKIVANIEDEQTNIRISLKIEGGTWGDTSLLNAPSDLLSAYLIGYHHGGLIQMEEVNGTDFIISITLPLEGATNEQTEFDLSWLDNVLVRFENW